MKNSIQAQERYREWSSTKLELPFYMQSWWFDLTAPDKWSAVFSENNTGEIVGVFPFSWSRRKGITMLDNPPLSPFSNIWIVEFPNETKHSKVSRYRKTLNILIKELPDSILQKFKFDPDLSDWISFYNKGYQQRTRYTYLLDLTIGTEGIWENMARKVRQEAKNDNLTIDFRKDSSSLYTLMEQSFRKQKSSVPVSHGYINTLFQTVPNHIEDLQLTVRNKEGDPLLSQYVVIDNGIAYTLFSGTIERTSEKSLKSFMLWHLVKKLQSSCNSINFCGSMLPDVERRYRHFGATQVPYSIIYKSKYPFLTYLTGLRF